MHNNYALLFFFLCIISYNNLLFYAIVFIPDSERSVTLFFTYITLLLFFCPLLLVQLYIILNESHNLMYVISTVKGIIDHITYNKVRVVLQSALFIKFYTLLFTFHT